MQGQYLETGNHQTHFAFAAVMTVRKGLVPRLLAAPHEPRSRTGCTGYGCMWPGQILHQAGGSGPVWILGLWAPGYFKCCHSTDAAENYGVLKGNTFNYSGRLDIFRPLSVRTRQTLKALPKFARKLWSIPPSLCFLALASFPPGVSHVPRKVPPVPTGPG